MEASKADIDMAADFHQHNHVAHPLQLPSTGGTVDFLSIGLNTKDLEMLSLVYYDGYSHSEVGSMYGIHRQSVKNRMDKCKRILAKAGLPELKVMQQPKRSCATMTTLDPVAMDEMIDTTGKCWAKKDKR